MIEKQVTRIGPKMKMAVSYVSQNPGCHPCTAGRSIGPNHSVCFGLQSVNRAISAGLIRSEPDPGHRGRSILFVVGD